MKVVERAYAPFGRGTENEHAFTTQLVRGDCVAEVPGT
jgi:hypothetical protein